jgi:hypothetical protein
MNTNNLVYNMHEEFTFLYKACEQIKRNTKHAQHKRLISWKRVGDSGSYQYQ